MNFIVEDENGREVTVWTSDNFTPGNYLPLAGGTLSGILKVKSKLFVSELPGFQDVNPSINLAIGDSDTGFHSIGDGEIVFYSNNRILYNMKSVWHSGNFDPNDKLNVTGGSINGNLDVTGTTSSNIMNANSGSVTTLGVGTLNMSGEAVWAKNTDFFKVGFKNNADGDTDSYGYIEVGDNGNEYFKVISVNNNTKTDWLSVKNDGIYHKTYKAWTTENFDPSGKANTNHSHSYLPTTGGTLSGNLTINGWLRTQGDITAFWSDRRLKSDIKKVNVNDSILNKLDKIEVYSYLLKGKEKHELGVMAQELIEIFPELVISNDGEEVESVEGELINPFRVSYTKLIPYLLLSYKSLKMRVEELERQKESE